jgi:predicted exporter
MALTIPANYSLLSSANLNVYHPKLYALLWLLSNPQQISQDNLQELFGPMGQLQAANLEQDPLLLFARYLQAQNSSPLNIEQDVVVVQDDERHWAVCLLAVLIGGGLWQLNAKDDVRLLLAPPPVLVASDAKIKQLLPFGRDNQFFVVTGNSEAEWYKNEQRLTTELARLQQQSQLKSHTAISDLWPDTARQQENYHLLKNTVYSAGHLRQYMAELGFSEAAITQELAHFKMAETQSLSLSD